MACASRILEEIHKIREEHAKTFNYDLQAICDDLASAAQSVRGEHLTLPSHTTHHAGSQWAVHERRANNTDGLGVTLDFHPEITNR